MIDRLGVHAAHDANVISDRLSMWQQLANLQTTFPAGDKLPDRRQHLLGLAGGHGGETLATLNGRR